MHIIDNFITQKFLEEVRILFKKYNINTGADIFGIIYRHLIFNNNFRIDLFNIYKNHYHRNLNIAELLASKQNLETERQVINIVKNHITISNITLRNTHIINLCFSYIEQRIIQSPENPNSFKIERPE